MEKKYVLSNEQRIQYLEVILNLIEKISKGKDTWSFEDVFTKTLIDYTKKFEKVKKEECNMFGDYFDVFMKENFVIPLEYEKRMVKENTIH
jgi:hypothetical protein